MKVSVIVPVYNVEKYIRECILSILKQTLKDIEIIIVNDGSTDKSIEEIEDLINQHENIKLINKENKGLSSARNEGLKYAEGEYIAFIDSDDYIREEFLETLYNEGKRYDLDVVFSSFSKFYEGKEIVPIQRSYELVTDDAILGIDFLDHQIKLKEYRMEVCDDLYRRDFLNSKNIKFWEEILFEDEEFTLSVLLEAERVKLVNRCDYIYRQRENSITHCEVTNKHIESQLLIINRFIEIYHNSEDVKIKICVYTLINNLLWEFLELVDESTYKNKKILFLKVKNDEILEILKENIHLKNDKIKFILFKISPKLYWCVFKLRSKIIYKQKNKNRKLINSQV